MTCESPIQLGTFTAGEKPAPLTYTFLDFDGTVINLTGYTAKFVIKEHDGAAQTFNAVVSAPTSGQVTYAWAGTEWPTAGHYEAEFVVGNTTNRYNSLKLTFNVRLPVGIEPNI